MSVPVNKKTFTLNDGTKIPAIGLGTYLSAPHEVTNAVVVAWKAGYRHFDCAQFYKNEHEVGEALQRLSSEPGFDRKDIWITSKVWNSHHSPEWLKKALDQTLKDLGTDYLDLYLVHWPVNFAAVKDPKNPGRILLEPQKDGNMLIDETTSLIDTWEAMIEVQKSGKVKSIGVSNFRPELIQLLIDKTGVTPSVNQEAHPVWIQQDLVDYGAKNNIHISAYMPFGGDASRGATSVLGSNVVKEIAASKGKDAGQVLGSWGIKRGFSVLPKSVKESRIKSNFEVFDLDNDSYEKLTELGRKNPIRFGGIPCSFYPAWKVNVFNTPEEQAGKLLEPF